MSRFAMRSFCDACGRLRGRLPFGRESSFFDANMGPCFACGESGPGHQHICRRGGTWRQRMWVDRDGHRVDVPVADLETTRV